MKVILLAREVFVTYNILYNDILISLYIGTLFVIYIAYRQIFNLYVITHIYELHFGWPFSQGQVYNITNIGIRINTVCVHIPRTIIILSLLLQSRLH